MSLILLVFCMAVVGITLSTMAWTTAKSTGVEIESGATSLDVDDTVDNRDSLRTENAESVVNTDSTNVPSTNITVTYPNRFSEKPILVAEFVQNFSGNPCNYKLTSATESEFTGFVFDCPTNGYQMATGTTFAPQVVTVGSKAGEFVPAVLFAKSGSSAGSGYSLYYRVARDKDGRTWEAPVLVFNTVVYTSNCAAKLVVLNGLPILCVTIESNHTLYVRVAGDKSFTSSLVTSFTRTTLQTNCALCLDAFAMSTTKLVIYVCMSYSSYGAIGTFEYNVSNGTGTLDTSYTIASTISYSISTNSPRLAAGSVEEVSAFVCLLPTPYANSASLLFFQRQNAAGVWQPTVTIASGATITQGSSTVYTGIALGSIRTTTGTALVAGLQCPPLSVTSFETNYRVWVASDTSWSSSTSTSPFSVGSDGLEASYCRMISNSGALLFTYNNGTEVVYQTASSTTELPSLAKTRNAIAIEQGQPATYSSITTISDTGSYGIGLVYMTSSPGTLYYMRPNLASGSWNMASGFTINYQAIGTPA